MRQELATIAREYEGAVRVNYRDAEDLKGDFTLFLVVERLADGE